MQHNHWLNLPSFSPKHQLHLKLFEVKNDAQRGQVPHFGARLLRIKTTASCRCGFLLCCCIYRVLEFAEHDPNLLQGSARQNHVILHLSTDIGGPMVWAPRRKRRGVGDSERFQWQTRSRSCKSTPLSQTLSRLLVKWIASK